MKSKVNLASNQCLCKYDKEVNQNYFCKRHLEKWSFKHWICKFQVFPGFELKFQVFTTFGANSRHFPGLEKKMTKFQVFHVFQVGWEPCDKAILTMGKSLYGNYNILTTIRKSVRIQEYKHIFAIWYQSWICEYSISCQNEICILSKWPSHRP